MVESLNMVLKKEINIGKGNLFVFDDRLVVPISDKEKSEVISHCCHCGTTVDTYYNYANMDCNELFISCKSCAEKMKGCCQESCMDAPPVFALFKHQIIPSLLESSLSKKRSSLTKFSLTPRDVLAVSSCR